jgi:DNA-binding GntR family transcriptional regulator
MGTPRKIERPRQVSEVVLERLRQDIVTGVFALGEKISETQLAEAYGVTKAPVRAAYLRLQAEGLVEVRPQSGTYVFAPSQADLRALCELRIALELEAVRLAMARQPEAMVTAFQSLCQRMQDALAKGQQDRYQRLDSSFHLTFFDLADSPYLKETYEARTASAFAALRHRFALDASHNRASIEEHLAITACIASGDLAGLHALLRAHIQKTEAYYQKLLGG